MDNNSYLEQNKSGNRKTPDEVFDVVMNHREHRNPDNSRHNVGAPGVLARRRAAMGQSQMPGEIIQDEIVQDKTSPEIVENHTIDTVVAEKPATEQPLEDFVEFDGSGKETAEQVSNAKPEKFDQAVEGSAGSTNSMPKPTVEVLGNNKDRAKALFEGKDLQVNNTDLSKQTLGTSPADTGENKPPDIVQTADGGGQNKFQELNNNKATRTEMKIPVQTPVVTVDNVSPAPAEENKTSEPVTKPEEVLGENEVPITYQPANEQRVAEETMDNGVDEQVAEIQARINNGDAKFDKDVDGERAKAAESAIAPAPEKPKPVMEIGGEGVAKPREEGMGKEESEEGKEGQDDKEKPDEHEQMAKRVRGDEPASFFAKLSGRLIKKTPEEKELPKAA